MYLRPFASADLRIFAHWLKQDHVLSYFGDPRDWLLEVQENMANSDWIYYYIFETNRPIGFAQYYDLEHAPENIGSGVPKGTVGIDYLIGDKQSLNKGYGTRIISMLMKIIRSKQHYDCIIADPDPTNKASTRALEKNGFLPKPSGQYRFFLTQY